MENKKNKIGFVSFLVVIVVFGFGGYLAMKYFTNNINQSNSFFTTPNKEVDKRLDKSKDFVYYDEVTNAIEDLNIEYKNIHINFESGNAISLELNKEMAEYRKTIKYTKDVELDDDVEYEENDEGVYSLTYRDYVEYDYENYITIIIKDSDYNVINGTIPKSIKSYIIDKNTGSIITEEEILEKYNTNIFMCK